MKKSVVVRLLTALVLVASVLGGMLASLPSAQAAGADATTPQGWISTLPGSSTSAASVQVTRANASTIALSAEMAGVSALLEKNEQDTYTRLSGDGYGHRAVMGQPDLPVLRRDVEIPFGASASLEVVRADYREVRLADLSLPVVVLPLQPSQPKCGESLAFIAPTDPIYAADSFFPAAPAAISAEYVVRGHRALTVDFMPVTYNPVQGTLRLYSRIEIRIRLTGSDMVLTESQANRYASPSFENRLSPQLLNFNQGKPARQFAPNTNEGYLVVAPDNYASALAPFVTLKENLGFTVTLALLSQTGSTKEQIKAYIQNAYDTWTLPPSYVLLVGDVSNGSESMPTWTGEDTGSSTDLYYVTVAGTDYIPDIYRGRFPARTTTQLGYMVTRSQAYDAFSGAEPWVLKAALLATDDSGMYPVAEGTQNYVINTHTLPLGYTGTFPNNPQPGGDKLYAITYHANTTNVIAAINDGRSMVIYTGHGSYGGWAGPQLTPGDVRTLTSVNIFPFAAGFACLTGEFAETEVFGETWLVQPADKGGLAYLGSSTYSYWDEDDIMERRMMDRLYADVPDEPSISDIAYVGQAAVQADYPSSGQYYYETYNILGDPSVQILLEPKLPDFTLAADPTQVSICNAGSDSSTISIGSVNEFSTPVNLALYGAPAGVSHTFAPVTVNPPGMSVLDISSDGTTPVGQYSLELNAAAGALVHTVPLDLGIYSQVPAITTLLTPPEGASDQPTTPTFTWSAVEQAAAYDLQVATDIGFTSIVVDAANLASTSYTPAADLETGTYYYWRVRAHNACGIGEFTPPFIFSTVVAAGDCPLTATPTTLYTIDFEDGTAGWSHSGTGDTWAFSTSRYHTPTHAYRAIDPINNSDQRLVSPAVALPAADQGPLTLRFWNYQHMEPSAAGCYDGSILEVSTNNGTTWTQVPANKLLTDPYDGIINGGGNPLNSKQGWCGAPHDWINSVVDVTDYAGQSVQFRWRLGSDGSVGKEGWYVDDVRVQACVVLPDFDLTMDPATAQATALPGTTATFNLTLTNAGKIDDTYDINTEGDGWDMQVTPPAPVFLAAGESASLLVTVSVPVDVADHSQKIVTVTATSQDDPGGTPVSATSSLTITVEYYRFYLPVVARVE
jgi:hypothetical protein